MVISLSEMQSDLNLKDAGITRSSVNCLHKRKVNTCVICYVVK